MVELEVDERREGEEPALGRAHLDLLGELKEPVRIGRGGDDELHRKIAAAGERRGRGGEHLHAGHGREFVLHFGHDLLDGAVALVERLHDHAAETVGPDRGAGRAAKHELKSKIDLGRGQERGLRGFGVNRVLIGRGVGGAGENAEDDALVLGGSEFLG